ncbi:MAG TPA: RDD family protein [Blastocatellia bacterium]|nr:RDD family protein [Blastocatellia bacterium]
MSARASHKREIKPIAQDSIRSHPVQTMSGRLAAQPAPAAQKEANPIVEAALRRVRRATENANRAALPKIEPVPPIQPSTKGALAVDREATARALEREPEVAPEARARTAPLPEVVKEPIPELEVHEPETVKPAVVEPEPQVKLSEPLESYQNDLHESYIEDVQGAPAVLPIDELEPIDYLEAEIRKVDKTLGLEFARNESPSLVAHLAIWVIDLLTIAASCFPFFALAIITNGSFAQEHSRVAAGIIISLVSFFYLAITQSLCGKTFGMMMTNTRVVDAATFEPLTPARALMRTVGCFIAAAPLMIGVLWAIGNRRHRGWQDYFSGTMVARDF